MAGKAIVVGGSMGGLFAANLLLRAGWDVQVYERVAGGLSDRGAGIVTHGELFDALAAAGVETGGTLGVKVPSRVTYDPQGKIVGEQPYEQILTAWSRLFQGLRQALPEDRYHQGKALAGLRQDGHGVTAVFADGTQAAGDILVGADGIRSTVRGLCMPESVPRYAGYVAWRGLVEESDLSPRARAALMERFAFCLPPNQQMIAYPVAGQGNAMQPGRRRLNFVWYRPADGNGELQRLQTDAQGVCHEQGIAPQLIRPEVLDEVRRAAQETLPPDFAEAIRKTGLLFFQPIYDLASDHMVAGRVALLGDAAFVARPHTGMGVTKAAYDALALAEALRSEGGLARALASYDEQRVRFGIAIVRHSRHMGAYMQARLDSPQEREMARKYRDPVPVMRETAVSLRYLDLGLD